MAHRRRLAAGIALAATLIPAAAAFSTPQPPLRRGPACAVRRDTAASVGAPARLRAARAAPLRMSGAPGPRGDDEDEQSKSETDRDSMLPQPFIRSDNGTRDSEFALARVGGGDDEEIKNQYVKWLESLTPGEMVGQFMATAPPRVQSAVKNTVVGLLGSLRASTAFDASVVTTQRALASLMFQLEMTGYMFRNAEYRLALQKTLLQANAPELPSADAEAASSVRPQLKGSITVTLPDGTDVEVDANAYVSELSKEVESLKAEMVSLRQQEEENKLQDLLAYVQNLESEEMASLSSQVSAEVLDAMRQLVDTVIRGMGGDVAIKDGYDILTEVPSGTLAQLCMWQLVVGYNLREMEAREELNKQLSAGEDDESPDSPSAGDGAGAGGK